MNWDAMGAIAETLGAIGVIATLIYLTFQLRQNTNALKSTTYEAYNNNYNDCLDFNAQHSEALATVLVKPWSELTPAEKILYRSYAMRQFNMMEATFLHMRTGSIEEDVFNSRVAGFRYFISGQENLRESWKRLSRFAYADDFVEFMGREIIREPGSTD